MNKKTAFLKQESGFYYSCCKINCLVAAQLALVEDRLEALVQLVLVLAHHLHKR